MKPMGIGLSRDVRPIRTISGGWARMTFDRYLWHTQGGRAVRRALVIIECDKPRWMAASLAGYPVDMTGSPRGWWQG